MKTIGIVHLLPPYIPVPPHYYGGTERVAYALFKKLHEIRHSEDYPILPILIGKISTSIDKHLSEYIINIDDLIPDADKLNIHVFMFHILGKVEAIKREFCMDRILIHNHVIQRDSWIHLAYTKYKSLSTLHYDPPLLAHFRLRIILPKNTLFGAISQNQYLRLKSILGPNLIAYVHNGLELREYPFSRSKDDYFISINI
ncbi:glycosyltransferase family protein [Infirmifilum sp. SLHALR2]|nr:MAG: hypothetical protein B7L53_01620 [Thermofilum sp. NZ13]